MVGTEKIAGKKTVKAKIPGYPYSFRTIPKTITITEPEKFYFLDPDVLPYFEKSELLGIKVRAIFDNQSLGLFVPDGDVAVYIGDLIEACEHRQMFRVAEQLSRRMADDHDLVVFQFGSFEYLD
jgi:hypothetical protein